MSDDDADANASASLPDCPRCGESVLVTAVNGPMAAVASPCGCRIAPGTLESTDSE